VVSVLNLIASIFYPGVGTFLHFEYIFHTLLSKVEYGACPDETLLRSGSTKKNSIRALSV
jgi:hypothetical protein